MQTYYDPWELEEEEEESGAGNTGLIYGLHPDDVPAVILWSSKTLEQVLATGRTTYTDDLGYNCIPLDGCPARLLAVIHNLVRVMPRRRGTRRTEASAFRLLAMLGTSRLATLPEVQEIAKMRELNNGMVPAPSIEGLAAGMRYSLRQVEFKTTGRRWNPALPWTVYYVIENLSILTGLPEDMIGALAIITAISSSEKCVPERIVALCSIELAYFQRFLRETWRIET